MHNNRYRLTRTVAAFCLAMGCQTAAALDIFEAQVSSGADDAEEGAAGVSLGSSDLELTDEGGDNQTVGIRFNSVPVPPGTPIIAAWLQFQADETSSSNTTLSIQGQASGNAAAFTSASGDVTTRTRTAAAVSWTPQEWLAIDAAGPEQRTPDIRTVIQEIVNRTDWAAGNSLAVIITGDGNGRRTAESYEGNPAGAARLHIEYGGTPGNTHPLVEAGPDQLLAAPFDTLCLTGSASDDGIPSGAALTTGWVQVDGPASAVIDDPSALSTSVSFPQPGVYRLELQTNDSELAASDSLSVTVAGRIDVPADVATVQGAIDIAGDGDLIVLAPGIYTGAITISGKALTIASQLHDTGDRSYIDQTIIDGADAYDIVTVMPGTTGMTRFIGITVRNGVNGIGGGSPYAVLSCRVTDTSDAIDYEPGATGVIVRDSVIDLNKDDAVDFDGNSWGIVERNWLINNADDGIEVRLPSGGEAGTVRYIIRDNIITGNGEDGIQIIGSSGGPSTREFVVYGNLIADNVDAGISHMCCGQTTELFEGAALPERLVAYNNTFRNNSHGIIGGDDVIAVNNIFIGHDVAIKRLPLDSVAAHNVFFNNTTNLQDANELVGSNAVFDPQLAPDDSLASGSPAIDAGLALFNWNGATVLDLANPADYTGSAPDLGAFETPANGAPLVSAGSDKITTLPVATVNLDGASSDDALPAPPGAVSISWKQTAGACGVSFATPGSASTSVTLPRAGLYRLELTGTDGERSHSDAVTVQVLPAAAPGDADGDGITDDVDNCPNDTNPDQLNSDTDVLGNACDDDDDNDTLSDQHELTVSLTDPLNPDSDADGLRDDSDPLPLTYNYADGDAAPLGAPNGQVDAGDLLVCMRVLLGLLPTSDETLAHLDIAPAGTPDGVIDVADYLGLLGLVLPGGSP